MKPPYLLGYSLIKVTFGQKGVDNYICAACLERLWSSFAKNGKGADLSLRNFYLPCIFLRDLS